MPELIRLARQVAEVHRAHADCPAGLTEYLERMSASLLSHLLKEEQVLFPMLNSGQARRAQIPMAAMRHEHEEHGRLLAQLAQRCHDFVLPVDARPSWQALYAGLVELCEDLMQHIHLENNVLFPRAEQDPCQGWQRCC